ncbi:MAG: hypothetical protein WCF33_12835, partial [Pseudonocardiaceae bacterium]
RRPATPPAPTWRDTRSPGDLPLSGAGRGVIPERGPPEAPVFGWELGNLATVPGDIRWAADGLHLSAP